MKTYLYEYHYSDGSVHKDEFTIEQLSEDNGLPERKAKEHINQPPNTWWDPTWRIEDPLEETVSWGAPITLLPDQTKELYGGPVLLEVRGVGTEDR